MTEAAIKSNVIYLQSLTAIPDASSISDDLMVAVYEAVVAAKQVMETHKLYVEEGIEVLKKYMGDKEVLIAKDGRRIATWSQQYKQVLNEDLLKTNFPAEYEACCKMLDTKTLKESFAEVYELCCEEKKGNKPFCLK